MHTEPLTAARYPDTTDSTNLAQYYQNLAYDLAVNTIPRFATVAARDSAYAAYTTAGGTLDNGRICYTADSGWWRRTGGAWKAEQSGGVLSGTSGWSAYGVGFYTPAYTVSFDGRVNLRGMFGRTGANVVLPIGGTVPLATLPAAIQPASTTSPMGWAFLGANPDSYPVRLYVASPFNTLQVAGMTTGSGTFFTGNVGAVNLDGVSWYI